MQKRNSIELAAQWHRLIGTQEHDIAVFIGETERQHFRLVLADLSRWKIDDGEDQCVQEFPSLVVRGELRKRFLDADSGSKIDFQDVRRISSFGKWLNIDNATDANVDPRELIKRDGWIGFAHDDAWPVARMLMFSLHQDTGFTFRFAEDRIISRFHLEGIASGRQVKIYRLDPRTGECQDPLGTAITGEDGWVELSDPIVMRAQQGFIVIPQ